jgi:hypothetical protein
VKSISLSESDREGVLFEGVLGVLEELGILEEAVFTVKCSLRHAENRPKRKGVKAARIKR